MLALENLVLKCLYLSQSSVEEKTLKGLQSQTVGKKKQTHQLMWYIPTTEYYYSAIKRSEVLTHNTDHWKHYAKWSMPDTKEILYNSTYVKYLELANSLRQKVN